MTKQEKENKVKEAYRALLPYRGKKIAACIKSVSRSGMSRRIEFYSDGFHRIGGYIADLLDYPYAPNGISVGGCGMDMVFSTKKQ